MTRAAEENEIEKSNWHWRNTMRPVRFFNWDARAAAPFVVLLVFPRFSTIIFCILVTIIFQIFEKRGLTFPAAIRTIRVWLVGYERSGWLSTRVRTLTEYE